MSVILQVNNVNAKIIGDLTQSMVDDLTASMSYKTKEYNGFTFVEVEYYLFNRLSQTLPTGLCSNAISVLKEHDVDYEIIDKRQSPDDSKQLKLYEVTPHDFQQKIIDDAIACQRFVIQVATGGGKTVIAAAILAKLNLPAIFVVHTGDLFEQAYDELTRLLKVPIGRIGGGICDIQQISVVMIQTIHAVIGKNYVPFDEIEKDQMKDDDVVKKSFQRNKDITKYIQLVKCVLIDECHHLRADSYITVMKACKAAYYRGGLSATPCAEDGRDIILQAYAGKIIGKITASYLIRKGFLTPPKIYYLCGTKNKKYKFRRLTYRSIYKTYIVNSVYRNTLIVDCARRLRELDKTILITVTTKNHGKKLLKMLAEAELKGEFIYSKVNKMKRKEHIDNVRQRTLGIIIGTSLADEGLNIPSLDSLILAGGGKSPTRMIQRIGRTLRLAEGKEYSIVIDFKDNVRYLSGHYKKRRTICEAEEEFQIIDCFE